MSRHSRDSGFGPRHPRNNGREASYQHDNGNESRYRREESRHPRESGREFRGRDDRERSPSRDSYQSSRSTNRSRQERDYDNNRNHGPDFPDRFAARGRNDHRQGSHRMPAHSGRSMSSRSAPGEENLPQIPARIDVPHTGMQLSPVNFMPQTSEGRRIKVSLNHFALMSLPKVSPVQYSVHFELSPGSVKNGSDKVTIYTQERAMIKASNHFGDDFVFDGVSKGWSTRELIPVGSERSILQNTSLGNHPLEVKVTLRNEGRLEVSKVLDYIKCGASGTTTQDPALENWFKYLTTLFKHDPSTRFITVAKSTAFFQRSPYLTRPLESTGGVLEAIRGIFQAVSVTFGCININLDVTCSAFYTPDKSILDVFKTFNGLQARDNITPAMIPRLLEGGQRLIGMYFVVKHLSSAMNTKSVRIQGLSKQGAADSLFDLVDTLSGETHQTSVKEYFASKHGIDLRHPDLPLLMTRKGLFPMEICFTPQGERYKEALQGRETADFIKFATSTAHVRSSQIMENLKRLCWHNSKMLQAHGIAVEPRFMERPAYVLRTPEITYGSGSDQAPSTGSWNLRGKRFVETATFHTWGAVYFQGARPVAASQLENFLKDFIRNLALYGLQVSKDPPVCTKGNPTGNIAQIVEESYNKTGNQFRRKPQLLVFLLHESASLLVYKAIKLVCETKLGVASQVMIVEKSVNARNNQQYLANIAMKVNCKLGGLNSYVAHSQGRHSQHGRLMHIGADVSHPSPAERRKQPPPPSFAALTGSYDSRESAYTAVVAAQPAGEEMIRAQKDMYLELIKRYQGHEKKLPDTVILWRDGLSESQINQFVTQEVDALKKLRQEKGWTFKIAAIVAVKRHHTRMFPASEKGDKNGNVGPGTMVEASTQTGECDFFLVSASALQGCIVPCRYRRVYDEVGLTVQEISRLVMNSCFSYGKATRSVSQHSAVFYSHQVAERARLWLQKNDDGGVVLPQVHKDLEYTMFWQ